MNCRSTPEFTVASFAFKKPATIVVTNCASSPGAKMAVVYNIRTSICKSECTGVGRVERVNGPERSTFAFVVSREGARNYCSRPGTSMSMDIHAENMQEVLKWKAI